MPTDRKPKAAVIPLRTVRITDPEWDRFVKACDGVKLPIGETAGAVLSWWAKQPHEVRQLIGGSLAPEREDAVAAKLPKGAKR